MFGKISLTLKNINPGSSNISVDPLFFDFQNGDYRLFATSPCVDTGTNNDIESEYDFLGNSRITDGNADGDTIVDIGAIEYHLPLIISQSEENIEACENGKFTIVYLC